MERRATFVGLAVLLATACQSDGDEHLICTDIGCDSGASFDLGSFPASEVSRFTGARIEVCLDGACETQTIQTVPQGNETMFLDQDQPPDPRVAARLWRSQTSGALRITVDVTSNEYELFDDGDVYDIKITGSDASVLVERSWSATYVTTQPNGPGCSPTCRQATAITEL